MGLDFVYGDVKDGVLRPLDGQQRLTTLFLLHWYVASLRRTCSTRLAPWLRFSYATRPTARDFCRALAEHPFPSDAAKPSDWITDQPWYLYPWRHDPTISSMLVMLDAIHARLQTAQHGLRCSLGAACPRERSRSAAARSGSSSSPSSTWTTARTSTSR